MAKCQIKVVCGSKRRICRDSKGRITSHTRVSGKAGRSSHKGGCRSVCVKREIQDFGPSKCVRRKRVGKGCSKKRR